MTLLDIKDRSEFGAYLQANYPESSVGVEVGVFRGEFSRQILDGWKSGNLIGVDCYNGGVEFHLLSDAIFRNEEYVRAGNYSIFVCTSTEGSFRIPDQLTFVYLDAGHSYEEVYADIWHWRSKIKAGGILCGHDYGREGGVSRAVNEFMKQHPKLKLITKPCSSWFIKL